MTETRKIEVCGIEISEQSGTVLLRASRSPFLADGVAAMTRDQWRALVDTIKRGELDLLGRA